MPKRKLVTYKDDDRIRAKVAKLLGNARKEFHSILKTAKCFERQRLGKRLTRADTAESKSRINTEIAMLKSPDLNEKLNSHFNKILLKVKVFVESGLLPDEIKKADKVNLGSLTEDAALNNVVSGILNMKAVRNFTKQLISDTYIAMGIPATFDHLSTSATPKNKILNNEIEQDETSEGNKCEQNTVESPEWEGFESNDEEEKILHEQSCSNGYINTTNSCEVDKFSDYEDLIGDSSDEKSFDIKEHQSQKYQKAQTNSANHSSTTSLDQYCSDSSLHSETSSKSSIRPLKKQKSSITKSTSSSVKAGTSSTFLPTLMGGYWSGSEESASDLEDFTPAPKKNRRGQMARRALAEKKYGKMANHLKTIRGSSSKSGNRKSGKDSGWDPKRGAISDDAAALSKMPFRNHRHNGRINQFNAMTKFNAGSLSQNRNKDKTNSQSGIRFEREYIKNTPGTEAGNSGRKKDDQGVLHPSWQAAKRAKEMKQTAKFQGKKITFGDD
ncbi:putative cellular morphogenesis protein [Golovinomyces cichoracearum]|uniref:Putative cellular morphogenesis protein n=1 Tax=Golovinomyces cichoracearum TaxID=62708 RepID=A0A420HAU3_9PEZI|nr:putative cellular morphogenesis protein [Golovinomyces cichoracearum]